MAEEFEKRVYVHEFKENFNLNQVSGNEESLNRWIVVPDINRPGLELTGFTQSLDLKRVTIIGNKEIAYLNSIGDKSVLKQRYAIITDAFTPCIVITGGNPCPPILLKTAREKNFPIFESKEKTYRFAVQAMAYLDERLAPSDSFHGVMMNVYGIGVLLRGESGIGKSELGLDLIKRGHMLVADDRVDINRIHNDLMCEAPELLKNMLEIRGVGVIDITRMYGATSTVEQAKLDLIIELEPFTPRDDVDRIGTTEKHSMNILGLDVPLLRIPVKEGRQMGVIIESAVANHRLKMQGIDCAQIFEDRVMDFIKAKKG